MRMPTRQLKTPTDKAHLGGARWLRLLHLGRSRWLLLCLLFTPSALAADQPQARDKRLTVELFAEAPDIVTPTGLAIDKRGRVFVAESHTHFRPDNYDGPQADRILIFEDTDGDGRADKRTIFHEGYTHVMDIEFQNGTVLYVATRRDIHRMEDTDEDGRADKITRIVRLDTKGTYPHNGLSGLSWNRSGTLNFGLGENLGESYTLLGTDGTELSGGGEGGSTYVVEPDGKNLRRVSTGWWNPYGTCTDSLGRVFGTDNDPGASPPCRLIQIVEGGNYGYEYRYGRSGLHPLICWNGEIPGTLPMISGTGEAPCHLVAYESAAFPSEYAGNLFVPCWADHRVERYTIRETKTQGLAEATRGVLIEGDDDFRPVGIDVAPDGSVYISDWVSSSYSLHKQGRIWRIRPVEGVLAEPSFARAKARKSGNLRLHSERMRRREAASLDIFDEVRRLGDDPLLFSAALDAFSKHVSKRHAGLARSEDALPILLAARRNPELREQFGREWLDLFLTSPDPDVRFVAVKWVADEKLAGYRPDLEDLLSAKDLDYRSFRAVAAALDRLDGKKPTDYPSPALLLGKIRDDNAPVAIRRLCLRLISTDPKKLMADDLTKLLEHPDHTLRLEAVRTLAVLQPTPSLPLIAVSSEQPTAVRAAAIAGLGLNVETHRGQLVAMATYASGELRAEALRAVVGVELSESEQQAMTAASANDPTYNEAIQRLLNKSPGERPGAEDIAAWKELLAGEANAEAGERVFFGTQVGTCSRCHQIDGRGTMVGPDLSAISRRVTAEGERGVDWLLETILQPSKHMAPQYTPWQIVTNDGKQLVGLPRRKGGNAEAYLGLDGKEFTVKKPDIEFHREMPKSIMPEGLLQNLTKQELRDLFAFLLSGSR